MKIPNSTEDRMIEQILFEQDGLRIYMQNSSNGDENGFERSRG